MPAPHHSDRGLVDHCAKREGGLKVDQLLLLLLLQQEQLLLLLLLRVLGKDVTRIKTRASTRNTSTSSTTAAGC